MPTETNTESIPASQFTQRLVDALVASVENASSPEMMAAQAVMIRRLALAGDVAPSRIPAPSNITQIGGYLNFLMGQNQAGILQEMLASVLGVAGPMSQDPVFACGPVQYFSPRRNDRPAGPAQAAIPTHVRVRSDFAPAFDALVADLHDAGCTLPLLSLSRSLPPPAVSPSTDLLPYLGRVMEFVPGTALVDPDNDPVALARLTAGGPLQVVARQVDAGAPKAATVASQDWTAWTCTDASCTERTGPRKYLPLGPALNDAGWYGQPVTAPVSLSRQGTWACWTNITGLVAGVTTLGDELRPLYPEAALVASSIREYLSWTWDGKKFAKT